MRETEWKRERESETKREGEGEGEWVSERMKEYVCEREGVQNGTGTDGRHGTGPNLFLFRTPVATLVGYETSIDYLRKYSFELKLYNINWISVI